MIIYNQKILILCDTLGVIHPVFDIFSDTCSKKYQNCWCANKFSIFSMFKSKWENHTVVCIQIQYQLCI